MSLYNSSILPKKENSSLSNRVDNISFQGNRVVLYSSSLYNASSVNMHENSIRNLQNNRVKKTLSKKSTMHLRKHVTPWLTSITLEKEYRKKNGISVTRDVVFITLTLCSQQLHEDKYLKRELFGRFIDEMRKKGRIDNYFVRYEKQDNGNIHAHLIIDKFLNKDLLTQTWNSHLDRLGYLIRFEKKHGHRQPPSTHIKHFGNGEAAVSYCLKYVQKNEKSIGVDGRQYGMSDSLRNIEYFTANIDYQMNLVISDFIENKKEQVYITDYAVVLIADEKKFYKGLGSFMRKALDNYYRNVYNYVTNRIDLTSYVLSQKEIFGKIPESGLEERTEKRTIKDCSNSQLELFTTDEMQQGYSTSIYE